MEKDHDDYPASFPGLDYSSAIGESSETNNNLHQQQQQQQQQQMLSFADVMQFADFGPKLLSNGTNKNNITIDGGHSNNNYNGSNVDPVYFLKFPVLNDKLDGHHEEIEEDEEFGDELDGEKKREVVATETKSKSGNKRKRGRNMKTSEEVESQRMTHIAVERNRRKQMNEHLRVLRSLMPGSYVQRGDQASIIGGAIEFVRELEQLLQCLESQKRRRLYGDDIPRPITTGDTNTNPNVPTTTNQQSQQTPPMFTYPDDNVDFDTGLVLREEMAEKNSGLADVEVKLLGFDGIIKILCRRRQGQLIKIIAALEDFKLHILHTNITTVEQTVLYSFNVKVANESGFTAEDIANSVQQIFAFIHASSV